MAKRAQEITLAEQLATARYDHDAARAHAEAIANEESQSLTSDEIYGSWRRRSRVAEMEVERLRALIDELQNEERVAAERDALDRYSDRYDAAADANRKVAELFRVELPRIWAAIAGILKQAALAEIETAAVRKAMPPGFVPSRSLGDPEDVRRRPALEEEILADEVVLLWTDKVTGHLFADQDTRPKRPAAQRHFRQVAILPARRGDAPLPFYKELLFPRVGQSGPVMFDGRSLQTPEQVLCALDASREAQLTQQPRTPQMRIEPVSSTVASTADGGPAIP